MKPLLSLVLFTSAVTNLMAVEVSVSARIVDTGITDEKRPVYALEVKVRNLTNSTASYTIMLCSWYDMMLVEPEKEFSIVSWPCDANAPVEMRIKPRGLVTFRFHVTKEKSETPRNALKMKVGFVVVPWTKPVVWFDTIDAARSNPNMGVWSNELEIPRVKPRLLPESHKRTSP